LLKRIWPETFKSKIYNKENKVLIIQYDKQDQHGKAAFNERNPHTIKQQEPVAPQTKNRPGQKMIQNRTSLLNRIKKK
jgi:hypothetical protein